MISKYLHFEKCLHKLQVFAQTASVCLKQWLAWEISRAKVSFSFQYQNLTFASNNFQLGNLERKWQHHEQNNFVMNECILSVKIMCSSEILLPCQSEDLLTPIQYLNFKIILER